MDGLPLNPPPPPHFPVAFRNEHRLIDCCPALIFKQVVTIGQLPEGDAPSAPLAPTWKPIYLQAITQLA